MGHEQPSRISAAVFSLKAAGLRAKRALKERHSNVVRLVTGKEHDYPNVVAEVRTALWNPESLVERTLQQGKVQNLRMACARLNNTRVSAGQVFSFWKQIGRASKSGGYVAGRELRQGCLIPSVGGGLCQLSNSVYELALRSGCEIVERHGHTAVVPGSAAEQGRDATVFWNYVDLRFRPHRDILITSILTRDELVVAFRSKADFPILPRQEETAPLTTHHSPNTCTDCGQVECFRHEAPGRTHIAERSAFLIEECWPEFQEYVNTNIQPGDELFLPFQSRFFTIPRYQWEMPRSEIKITTANIQTVRGIAESRFSTNQNIPTVQTQMLRSNELADHFGRKLKPGQLRVYIAQSLLPALWRSGHLGGRSFAVLMSRMPLNKLHQRLDELSARYPERETLVEYRAPDWMVEAEADALLAADEIVTPHSYLAGFYPHKTRQLTWRLPSMPVSHRRSPEPTVFFPGPSLARKGAFEVRGAIRALGCRLMITRGSNEYQGFWDGIEIVEPASNGLQAAHAVIQPAFFENNPRSLLNAIAAGIPVIATEECGLSGMNGVSIVRAGEPEELTEMLGKMLGARAASDPVAFEQSNRAILNLVKFNCKRVHFRDPVPARLISIANSRAWLMRSARSVGVSCSKRRFSVRSTPNSLAASILLPGAGIPDQVPKPALLFWSHQRPF